MMAGSGEGALASRPAPCGFRPVLCPLAGAVVADTTMVGAIIAIGGDRLLITYQEAASVWLGPLSS
jgi:hypothetical protein